MNNIIIDPEFEKQIPPLLPEELAQLEANIVEAGEIHDPIIVWDNIILDGHNRYKIAMSHPEVKFSIKELEFAGREQAIVWMCMNQLGRRNLTYEQKKYLMGKHYHTEKSDHGASDGFRGNAHTESLVSYQNGNLLKTCDKLAKDYHVGRSSIVRAGEFSKGLDAAEEVVPGILQEVLSGKLKPTQDEVAALARASPEKRAELVSALRTKSPKKRKVKEPISKNAIPAEKNIPLQTDLSVNQQHSDAIGELSDAAEMFTYRWNRCLSIYDSLKTTEKFRDDVTELLTQMQNYISKIMEKINGVI